MYIKINLLPQQFRPKRMISIDLKMLLVLVLCVCAAVTGFYYFYTIESIKKVNSEIAAYKKQERQLQELLNMQNEVDSLKTVVTKKVEIIKELSKDNDVRFEMITHLNRILPENMWLLNITESLDGGNVGYKIDGMTYTKESISKFLDGLTKYDKFSKISLESITPAPLEVRDAFNYSIRVELACLAPAPAKEKSAPNKSKDVKKTEEKSKTAKKK